MSAQNIGIIYSVSQQVIRVTIDTRWDVAWTGNLLHDGSKEMVRVPAADPHDRHLAPHQANTKLGEAWAMVPCAIYDTHTHVLETHAYLGLSGIPGVTDRCIVHDGKNVKAVIQGDPLIDSHALGTVVADSTGAAVVGLAVVNGIAQLPPPPVALSLDQLAALQKQNVSLS